MDRDAIIERYRHLHDILVEHNAALVKHVSRQNIFDQARRLGLREGNRIFADSDDEITLVFDLAIYAPGRGRSRAIDRYRRALRLPPGSDEAHVVESMCAARFSIWRVERRHELAGLVVLDVIRRTEQWLVDLGLELTAEDGMSFAGHLFTPGPFSMTTGMPVPVDGEILEEVFDDLPPRHAPEPSSLADDPLFATLVCRAALAHGAMERIDFA